MWLAGRASVLLRQALVAARCSHAIIQRASQHLQSYSTTPGAVADGRKDSPLLQHIKTKILMRGGPITLAEYMQDALTSPHGGFYMHRDVFGAAGHFTTSPEISQMFGEMLGAWAAHTWSQLGQPQRLLLVEMGPGRGTLMADMLRATSRFRGFASALEVHLVEVSPALRAAQWAALRCSPAPDAESSTGSGSSSSSSPGSAQAPSGQQVQPDVGVSGWNGATVTWHSTLDSVPGTAPALFVLHEFIDALPVHQFVKDDKRGWLEKLVDVAEAPAPGSSSDRSSNASGSSSSSSSSSSGGDSSSSSSEGRGDSPGKPTHSNMAPSSTTNSGSSPGSTTEDVVSSGLRLVLSPASTPAAALLVGRRLAGMAPDERDACKAVEVCGHGMAVAEALALRVGRQGGAALVVDYGKDGPYTDSLMAIKEHKGVRVLEQPGTADLSAWVDFGALRQAALEAATTAATAAESRAQTSRQEPKRVKNPASQAFPSKSTTAGTGLPSATAAAAAATLGGSGGVGGVLLPSSAAAAAAGPVAVYGPVPQGDFLLQLGMGVRLEALLKRASPEQTKALRDGFARLTGQEGAQGMGRTYQVMCIAAKSVPAPAGFEGGRVALGDAPSPIKAA